MADPSSVPRLFHMGYPWGRSDPRRCAGCRHHDRRARCVTDLNPAAEKLFGYGRPEALGRPVWASWSRRGCGPRTSPASSGCLPAASRRSLAGASSSPGCGRMAPSSPLSSRRRALRGLLRGSPPGSVTCRSKGRPRRSPPRKKALLEGVERARPDRKLGMDSRDGRVCVVGQLLPPLWPGARRGRPQPRGSGRPDPSR